MNIKIILAVVVYSAFTGASGYLGWRFGRWAGMLHERWLPEGNVQASTEIYAPRWHGAKYTMSSSA